MINADLPLGYFDDNVLDPISRKGQEEVYNQFADLLSIIEPNMANGFEPCYTVAGFFERIGEGNLWEKVNIYEGTSIPLESFDNRERLADEISKISNEIIDRIKNHEFFSKHNLNNIYQKSCVDFVGNNNSNDLLNSTFYRFGSAICSSEEDHFSLIGRDLWWDRLVAFPVLWDRPENIQDKAAKEIWVRAEKFYDCLFAAYHNQKLIDFGAPFTRLLLQRRFIDHFLRLKNLKHERKKTRWLRRLLNLYRIRRLEGWVKKYRWAFKFNIDLVDVKLLHFAIYGFSIFNKEGIAERRPGICVTCDPIEVVEQRLFLCMGSHDELSRRVDGWDLSLCPGKIICLSYQNFKFSHVKTIDVKKFFEEYSSRRNRLNGLKFKLRLFIGVVKESIKLKLGCRHPRSRCLKS